MKIDLGGLKGEITGFKSVNINDFGDINHDLNVFPYPFEDNTVDEVIMFHVLEHLEKPLKVMEETWRICKPGALVHIKIPVGRSTILYNPYHLHDFKTEWFENLNPSAPVAVKDRTAIKVNLNFDIVRKSYKRGSIRFWKKYELYIVLKAVKD